VTEATDAHDELFGEERLVEALNKDPDAAPKELLVSVRADIDAFVADAPQFDDITMLAIKLSYIFYNYHVDEMVKIM
jgi:serine phosphatase RsbU (regulator of sigma subunit)